MTNVMERPVVAISVDEDIPSGHGDYYETEKNLPRMVDHFGGTPRLYPYLQSSADDIINTADALIIQGGMTGFLNEWHTRDEKAVERYSERLEHLQYLLPRFLETQKPVLGLCFGAQFLGCMNGCKLSASLRADFPNALQHIGQPVDGRQTSADHDVILTEGSVLREAIGQDRINVNSIHNTCLSKHHISDLFTVAAQAEDGIVEAIEMKGHPFAIGLQWHQEKLFKIADHPSHVILERFIQIAAEQKFG